MQSEFITVIGPISAAVIAGSITFIITVLSKEQKTSEFRQAWIDALRNDIADLIGYFGTTTSVVRLKLHSEDTTQQDLIKYLLENESNFVKMETLINRIKLRINPEEHEQFVSALNEFSDLPKDTNKLNDSSISDKITLVLLNESQALLKTEWKRVKRGEVIFRITKWASLAIFIAATIVGGLYINGHIFIQYIP